MTLQEILNFRRAVRHFQPTNISVEKVKTCIEHALLTPTSSNMQLYHAYHVTDPAVIAQLGKACLSQRAATTAQQMVVFTIPRNAYRQHTEAILAFEKENVKRNSPKARHAHRIHRYEVYYGKLMPFLHARCFGLLGLFRKCLVQVLGLRRPMVRQVTEGEVRMTLFQSCGMVAETFMLAMAEAGYDTCPLGGFDSYRVKQILHLPHSTDIGMIVSCGLRDEKGVWGDRFRFPMSKMYTQIGQEK